MKPGFHIAMLFTAMIIGLTISVHSARASTVSATYDVVCTGGSCLNGGFEMYGDTSLTPGGGLIEVGIASNGDWSNWGSSVFRLSGFETQIACSNGDCDTGWTEVDPNNGNQVVDTAACLGSGCFSTGISFIRSVSQNLTPWNINFLGVLFDVTSAQLNCRSSDCAANGWDIYSGNNLIGSASCAGVGCLTTGYTITTYVLPAAVPLPAAASMLAGSIALISGCSARRRRKAKIG